MRIASIILPVAVTVAVLGAYAAGRYIGQHDEQKVVAGAISNLDASRSAEGFMLASTAREALRESKPETAELVLVRYAALKAPALMECSASPACVAWVGKLM